MKIFDGEMKLMEMIWANEPVSAKEISAMAAKETGWKKNTTYTVIKKLTEKGYIQRHEPEYIITSLVKRDEVCKSETRSLIEKLYNGSKKALFSALLEDEDLTRDDIEALRELINKK